jgi:hypothetical protein
MDKRFTTVELPKPNKWGIWYDGAYLSTYQVCTLLNEYVDVLKVNKQLKQENNDLIKLINDLGNEEMDRQMEEILE